MWKTTWQNLPSHSNSCPFAPVLSFSFFVSSLRIPFQEDGLFLIGESKIMQIRGLCPVKRTVDVCVLNYSIQFQNINPGTNKTKQLTYLAHILLNNICSDLSHHSSIYNLGSGLNKCSPEGPEMYTFKSVFIKCSEPITLLYLPSLLVSVP